MERGHKKVCAIIPCFNEAAGIARVIERFPREKLAAHGYTLDILVVDNASTDRTADIARSMGATVITERRKGKGSAMRAGFLAVPEDAHYVVMLDGDDTYRPEEMVRLLELLDSGFASVALGSRLGGRVLNGSMGFVSRLGNWLFSHLVRILYRVNVTDVLTGYFAWHHDALRRLHPHLRSDGFAIEMEMVTKMARLGEEIYCLPVTYAPRAGTSNLRPFHDGARILSMLVRNFFWRPPAMEDAAATEGDEHMRVVAVAHYYPPHVGGLEVVAQRQARQLVAAGHPATVVTSAVVGAPAGTANEGGVIVERCSAWNILDRRFGIPFPVIGLSFVRVLRRRIRESDLVHIHDVFYMPSWAAFLTARWYGKPVVLTQHVAIVEHPSRLVMLVQRFVYATIGLALMRRASIVIAYNTIVRDFLISRGVMPQRIMLMGNGIDLGMFHPLHGESVSSIRKRFGLPLGRPLALFVGRFVPKKGCDILFDARSDAYDIVFVGSGTAPAGWHGTSGVHAVGALTREELALLYRAVDLFVFPARGEVLTLVMQEAMASGLPVVTTDDPAYESFGFDRERICLVPPTVPALKASLTRLAGDVALRSRMGAYSRKIALERFDWDRNTGHVPAAMRALVPKHRIAVTTSWDDGHVLDLKMAALLKRYGLGGTFYIAPEDRELRASERLTQEQVATLARDFEIGAHTMTHRYLPSLDDESARQEIMDSRAVLERWVGRAVTSFCYPKGGNTRRDQRLAREAGFSLSRTTIRFAFRPGTDPHRMPTSIHTYDHWLDIWGVLKLARFNPLRFLRLYRRWDRQAIALFDRVLEEGGVFHLWGHSWEVEAHGDWERLEEVFDYIANRPGVSYVHNTDTI